MLDVSIDNGENISNCSIVQVQAYTVMAYLQHDQLCMNLKQKYPKNYKMCTEKTYKTVFSNYWL